MLTQTKSRIGFKCGMRRRIGEANWAAFVRYAEAEYKSDFLRALTPDTGVLRCEGRLDGAPCPKQVRVDLTSVSSVECAEQLPMLHIDHTHDVKRICRVWSEALPKEPSSWHEGVCGPLIAHLLFGTKDHVMARCDPSALWRKQLVVRCGNVRGMAGQQADDFCHDVASAHYEQALNVADVRWPVM